MRIEIIYPSDFVGGAEVCFTYETAHTDSESALREIHAVLQDDSDTGWPARHNLRPLYIGDIIIIGAQHYIVGAGKWRPVVPAAAEQWRHRTLVERMICSGEYAKVCAGFDSNRFRTKL